MARPRPATRDHLLSRKKPLYKTVQVVLDPELAEALTRARAEASLLAARLVSRPNDTALADQYTAAQAELDDLLARADADEVVVEVTFKSIGRAAYDELISAHPPTEAQNAAAKESGQAPNGLVWNPDTFPAAVVAASMVTPQMTLEDVLAIFNSPDWNGPEQEALVTAALEVNTIRRTVDLGKDLSGTRTSGRRSATAPNAASPTPSS